MKLRPFRDCNNWLIEAKGMPKTWRIWLQLRLRQLHARWNGLALARAEELNSALVRMSTNRLVEENYSDRLPDASLQDFITATRIIQEMGAVIAQEGTDRFFTMADRGIAAFYAEAHFGDVYALVESLGYSFSQEDEDIY